MNDPTSKNLPVTIIRWIARVWSLLSVAFILLMFLGEIFTEGFGTFNNIGEAISFLFFPLGVTVGMIIAWKWEGLGGFITTGSLIASNITWLLTYGQLYPLMIDALAFPGLLFIIYWILSRRSTRTKEELE